MKRMILFTLITLIGFSIQGQNTVSITGKVSNQSSNSISLSIRDFDTLRMLGNDDKNYRAINQKVQAEIWPDSTYLLTTDHIIRPFTLCKLSIGTKSKEIILSPGDSLVVDLDYWTLNSELEFGGKGAEKNNYWNDALRLSHHEEWSRIIGSMSSEARIKERNKMMNEELELLEAFQTHLDSTFYEWEKRRIQYDCYDSNVRFSIWYNNRYPNKLNETEAYHLMDFDDEEALLTMESYRSLVRNYREIHIASESSVSNGDMLLMFTLGEKMTGLVRSYFLWHVISNALTEAVDNKEKQLIWEFANKHVKDSKTKLLLDEMGGDFSSGYVLGKSFSNTWRSLSLVLGAIFLLAIGFNLLLSKRLNRGKPAKLHNVSFTRIILVLIFIVFVLVLAANDGLGDFWILLYLASTLLFVIINTSILLPKFSESKNYPLYFLSVIILLTGFYFAVYFTTKGLYSHSNSVDIIEDVLPIFITTSILMILYSIAYYFAGIVSRNKKGWSYLVDHGRLSIEAVIHVIVLSTIIISIAVGLSSPKDLRTFIDVLLAISIFYVSAYFLFSKFLFEKRYTEFIVYTILTLLGFALIISLLSGILTYTRLYSRGMTISFWKALDIPSLDLLVFALPGFIYAYARKIYKDKVKKAYSLYDQKEAEFNQLRSQVNPHFLFNSLNTVYAFALKEGNEKTAESIAKLANLMRYLIDDMEKDEIPIKKEIGYIEDYIKLQLIRSSVEHNISLKIDLDETQESKMIAPMLMIPFVENTFKHGVNPTSSSNINLKISFVDNQFQFVLENSVDKNFEAFYKEKGFGIGIENVRKRLEYIYPGNHTLSIADTDDRFIVIMEIQLSSNK